jgi:hypothetical protein
MSCQRHSLDDATISRPGADIAAVFTHQNSTTDGASAVAGPVTVEHTADDEEVGEDRAA